MVTFMQVMLNIVQLINLIINSFLDIFRVKLKVLDGFHVAAAVCYKISASAVLLLQES
jgi:hypothetical protein